jgi:hypothetical protein
VLAPIGGGFLPAPFETIVCQRYTGYP